MKHVENNPAIDLEELTKADIKNIKDIYVESSEDDLVMSQDLRWFVKTEAK